MVRKSKKYLVLIVLISIISVLSTSCSGKETLLFLNWGEYINYDMVEAFEKEYNCNVIVDLADSNELFYAKVKSGTTAYDLVCPAEYMAEKMYYVRMKVDDLTQSGTHYYDMFSDWESYWKAFYENEPSYETVLVVSVVLFILSVALLIYSAKNSKRHSFLIIFLF